MKAPALAWFDVLPGRYAPENPLSSAPMGSAPLTFADNGEVAWDRMWTGFCDLALAGGPKHRDTILEPASADDVAAAPDVYARVVAELERGLRLVTGLPAAQAGTPGWVSVQCDDEAMASWLLRAIAEENVSVRREGAHLFVPAAPDFRLEKEIKNVVTAVAKTFHYWQEHRRI
jgi:sirohydrochlorin cobaltochelatase